MLFAEEDSAKARGNLFAEEVSAKARENLMVEMLIAAWRMRRCCLNSRSIYQCHSKDMKWNS